MGGRTTYWYGKSPGSYQVLMNNACTDRSRLARLQLTGSFMTQ